MTAAVGISTLVAISAFALLLELTACLIATRKAQRRRLRAHMLIFARSSEMAVAGLLEVVTLTATTPPRCGCPRACRSIPVRVSASVTELACAIVLKALTVGHDCLDLAEQNKDLRKQRQFLRKICERGT